MENHSFGSNTLQERPALSSLLIIIGVLLVGMAIGNIVAAVIMIVASNIGLKDLANINQSLIQSPNGWLGMMLGQGIASIVIFICSGLFYWYVIEKKKFSDFNFKAIPAPVVFLFLFAVQLSFLPLGGWLQSVNENMKLPPSLKGLEESLKAMEESLAEVTKFLTTFDSIWQLILAFLVIAVTAGIGEELIFRGLIQRKLQLGLKNHHAAIWISAIIFSAFHMQFYGFLPRLMLGALFGYFYYWSGNLWVPIVAHIFNNGFAVVMLYLVNIKKVSPEIEKMDNVPLAAVAGSLALGIGFTYLLKKRLSGEPEA